MRMKNSLDKRTKWCYCIGATGRDAAYALVSMYLLTYVQYTMKLTVAQFGVISAAIVVCLIWDAVNDALMGIIIENTHFKSGKFKPWIIVGAVLNALVIVALFTLRPQGWGFVAFFATGYLLWGMTYTMNDIAYWGMLPSLSSDPKERDTLVTLMSVFICVGQFAVAGIVPTVVAGNAIQAYRVTALIVALAFIAFQTLVVLGVREAPRRDDAEKVTLRKMFTIFMRNDQLVPIGIASLLFNIGNGLLIIFGVNFFYFEFGYADSGDLIFLFTVMYGLGTLFSQALYAFISSRMHRMTILKICMAAIAVGYGMLMGFGYVLPKNVVLLNAIGFIIFFFQGLYNLAVIVMLNNTIEYDELRFGERHDSVISAIRSFSVKLAGAVNQGISFDKKGIDTLKLARKFLPQLPSRRLSDLCCYYGIETTSHRAGSDALSAAMLYERLVQDFPDEEAYRPSELVFHVKKESPASKKQKERLYCLLEWHKIIPDYDVERLTRNEASRITDKIILAYGRLPHP